MEARIFKGDVMKIIISPAKKMRVDNDTFVPLSKPEFLHKTLQIKESLVKMDLPALQKLWECNDEIASLNFKRLQNMNLERNLTPAVFAYDGLQYQHIAPNVLDEEALDYLDESSKDCLKAEYKETIYYKGFAYTFDENGFVDKAEIKEGPYLEKSNDTIIKEIKDDENVTTEEVVITTKE